MTEIATQIRDFDSKITSLEVIINHNSELSSRPTSNTGALAPATAHPSAHGELPGCTSRRLADSAQSSWSTTTSLTTASK